MTEVKALTRTFKFKTIVLPDPGEHITPENVKAHYLGIYPDLLNTQISEERKGAEVVYEFKPKTGTHG